MLRLLPSVFFLLLLYFFLSSPVQAEKLQLAVASNFSTVMQALKEEFEGKSTHTLVISYGSSGKFYAQISHGAPFDIFFSADQRKVALLVDKGLATKESAWTYAQGALVLWSANEKNASVLETRLRELDLNRLALANPRLAPYGLAARQSLESLGLLSASRPRWVLGENISQAYQFTVSAHADMGLLALSQVYKDNPAHYWLIPEHLYTPIKQDAVLLNRASESQAAKAFLLFARSNEARKIIRHYGYNTPG